MFKHIIICLLVLLSCCPTSKNDIKNFKHIADPNQSVDPPEVICECGCNVFTIRYGNYECLARCNNCRNEAVVYDG